MQKGDRVGVYSKNRFDFLDILFACGKIGAILTPFNIPLTTPETEYLLKKTNPSIVFYDPKATLIYENNAIHEIILAGETNILEFNIPERNALGEYQIESSEEEIERDCIEYQEKLTFILRRLAFITNYKLVTIKEIKVLKARHKDALFQHWIDILNSSDSDFRSKQEIFDSFSDSNAVLLMKSLKRPGEKCSYRSGSYTAGF